jgi:hypothetical protein
MYRLQQFEGVNRLRIIYTDMLMDKAKTEEQLKQAILQGEFVR